MKNHLDKIKNDKKLTLRNHYKQILRLFFAGCFLFIFFAKLEASDFCSQSIEHKKIANITLIMENLTRGEMFDQERALSKLRTKVGDPFSQITFDSDLKNLSEEYDRSEPNITLYEGEVYITIKIWQKPFIRSIKWYGNRKIKTAILQKQLGIKPYALFDRDAFNLAFNKVKEYYIKKGYFESEVEYKIIPYDQTNEVDIEFTVQEGHSGHVSKIIFTGLSKKEQTAIIELIQTKKYNFFTSWLTGHGNFHEEAIEQDQLVIVNYLQEKGYADARVHIQTKEDPNGHLEIEIHAIKGDPFHFGTLTVKGQELFSKKQILDKLHLKKGDLFSPKKLHEAVQNIKDFYGKDGYIETNISYSLHLLSNQPIYDVTFEIEESHQFRIGMIRVLGNVSTKKNVILRESLLTPGEVFDSRCLKATETRLEAVGYFKSVNVYAVQTPEDQSLGENYRDVVIEVEETPTGSFSLFGGVSTSDSLFAGLDLAENNFDHRGLACFWKQGFSALRGAGEFARIRAQFGKKVQNYSLAWMDPYFKDTPWRFGLDTNFSKSRAQSDDYHVSTLGGSIFANYPITNYWTFGLKWRLRNAIVSMDSKIDNEEAQNERQNSGLVSALSSSIGYDTTDNPFKPHRGIRSFFEIELGGVRRHDNHPRHFPFWKVSFLNTYYYPVWRKGTLKMKGDFRFIYPFGAGESDKLPLSERFFLGGDTTVRGYKPYSIGPKFLKKSGGEMTNAPEGGISSTLLSIEYLHQFFRMLDAFVFFDGGSISQKRFNIPDFRMSYGFGIRLELTNRIPFIFGWGFPINPADKDDAEHFFFSMGAQF